MNWFYEKNTELLESPVNKTFEELLWMTPAQFRDWVIELRRVVVYLWDEKGQPPRVGYDKSEIIEQFRLMEPFIVSADDRHPKEGFLKVDELTGKKNVVRNTSNLGNAVNQFFPSMMKTRINYSKDTSAGKSIYDYFADPALIDKFVGYASRHFKRDSFYHFSVPIQVADITRYEYLPVAKTGIEWIQSFESGHWRDRGKWDYWVCPNDEELGYTGYNEDLKDVKYLRLSLDQIKSLGDLIPENCRTNVLDTRTDYTIRVFEKGQKVFPINLKVFRVSFCQYATNFPPLTAKYIYEKYTEEWKHEEDIFVWDPSSGWGGRLLGAMAVEDRRHLVYLGNDPNTDHTTTPGRTKYHEIHDFYTEHVKKGGFFGLPHTDFKFWQQGSEEMQYEPDFQQYKGKLSLVFTSPPYFAKEAYSEDPAQSYKKFSQYDLWRDGFLHVTLKTAYEWLRPGGYLAWNIADAVFGGEMLPLEADSRTYLESLGMVYQDTVKMTLAQMPGGNRLDTVTGLPKAKNFCKVLSESGKGDMWLKYEPIMIFRKPI